MSGAALAKARADAAEARQRLIESARTLQTRLSPATVVGIARRSLRESGDAAAEKAARVVTQRPAVTVAAIAGIAAFFARKPIARLLRRGRSRPSDPAPRRKPARRTKGDRA